MAHLPLKRRCINSMISGQNVSKTNWNILLFESRKYPEKEPLLQLSYKFKIQSWRGKCEDDVLLKLQYESSSGGNYNCTCHCSCHWYLYKGLYLGAEVWVFFNNLINQTQIWFGK